MSATAACHRFCCLLPKSWKIQLFLPRVKWMQFHFQRPQTHNVCVCWCHDVSNSLVSLHSDKVSRDHFFIQDWPNFWGKKPFWQAELDCVQWNYYLRQPKVEENKQLRHNLNVFHLNKSITTTSGNKRLSNTSIFFFPISTFIWWHFLRGKKTFPFVCVFITRSSGTA